MEDLEIDWRDRHRRILHFEFAGIEALPDGYRWLDFIRADSNSRS